MGRGTSGPPHLDHAERRRMSTVIEWRPRWPSSTFDAPRILDSRAPANAWILAACARFPESAREQASRQPRKATKQ